MLHEDIQKELKEAIKESMNQQEKSFKEEELDWIERLAQEYESNGELDYAEKYYKRLILRDKENP